MMMHHRSKMITMTKVIIPRHSKTKNVNVYKLIAAGTVEEKILELSTKKRELVSNVLSTEGSPLKGLTKTDVENLFSE